MLRKAFMAVMAMLVAVVLHLPASAADMHYDYGAYKAPVRHVQSIPAPYNWTGFYIGGHGGIGNLNTTETTSFGGLGGTSFSASGSGSTAGIVIGYDLQLGRSPWVFGIAADANWANLRASWSDTWCTLPGCGFVGIDMFEDRLKLFATARLRGGYLVMPNLLVYATGGFAVARFDSSMTTVIGGLPFGTTTLQNDRFGYAIGAGVEWEFINNWRAKVEYLRLGVDGPKTVSPGFENKTTTDIDIVRAGLNYRFSY